MDTFTGTKHRISSSKVSSLFIYTSGTLTTSTYFASMVLYPIPEGWPGAGAFTTKTFQASDSGRALSDAQAWVRRAFNDPVAKFELDRPFDPFAVYSMIGRSQPPRSTLGVGVRTLKSAPRPRRRDL